MKNCILFLFSLIVFTALQAQQTILVEQPNGSNTRVYQNLDSAVTHLTTNDRVYIPNGLFTLNTPITTDGVTFYGVGYKLTADNNKITKITSAVYAMADDLSFENIWFGQFFVNTTGADTLSTSVNQVSLLRCKVQSGFRSYSAMDGGTPDFSFIESVFLTNLLFYDYSKIFASRCIFKDNIYYSENSLFLNNLFLKRSASGTSNGSLVSGPFGGLRNSILIRNVFNSSYLPRMYYAYCSSDCYYNNNTFKNNLYNTSSNLNDPYIHGANIHTDPIYQTITFEGGIFPTTYYDDFDFHITDSLGIDGVGIYTDYYEWNDNDRPSNPLIVTDTIGDATNSFGQLPVKLKAITKSVNND